MLNNIVGQLVGGVPKPAVSGGTLYSDATYFYRVFTANGSLVVSTAALTHDILLIGGGGSGAIGKSGTYFGPAGAAGQVLAYSGQSLLGTKSITIGGGGTAINKATLDVNGNNGTVSTYQGLTSAAVGGGGLFNTGTGGTSGNGFAGGGPSGLFVGGGGGSGAVGANGNNAGGFSGSGGAGVNTITNWGAFADLFSAAGLGVSGYIAGGGGGGGASNPPYAAGAGGSGGGGQGAEAARAAGNGTANTGSGGGGGSYLNYDSGAGGSGLCVIRYLKADV